VLQTQDDFRLVIPYVEFSKQIRGVRPVLVDTSALVDGRIADIAATNFVQSPLVIPRFVVQELQTLADSGDAMKRSKGRRGLDVITKLQRQGTVDVSIDDTYVSGKAVDQMLVELARVTGAMVLTGDVGLARVASINSVMVLNLNDLANATRMSLVPGETITLRLMKPGEQRGQGVGYLPDGTMVVAEDGGGHIGETVQMTVTSSLQTSAGRLIFARIGQEPGEDEPPSQGAAAGAPTVAPLAGVPTDRGVGASPSGPRGRRSRRCRRRRSGRGRRGTRGGEASVHSSPRTSRQRVTRTAGAVAGSVMVSRRGTVIAGSVPLSKAELAVAGVTVVMMGCAPP
jgi:rRNA-processing protein FCF1